MDYVGHKSGMIIFVDSIFFNCLSKRPSYIKKKKIGEMVFVVAIFAKGANTKNKIH